jgi:hypothetical protein
MTTTAESLRVLGLSPSATLEDANQAYKDLVRVWHPDRFQSDQNLKQRAEESTRKINEAVSHLRKIFKNIPAGSSLEALERSSGNSRPSSQPNSYQDYRDDWDEDDYEEEGSRAHFTHPFTAENVTFQKSFFQNGAFAVLRTLKGCLAIALSYLIYSYIEATPPIHLIIAILLASRGASEILRNSALFFLYRPILVVSQNSLHIIEFGSVSLTHISDIRVTGDTGRYKIRINLYPTFLETLPFEYRLILKIRHLFKGSHFVLKGRGMDSDPTLVPRIFDFAISIPSPHRLADNLLPLRKLACSQIIASACLATCAIRCFLDGDIIPEITGPYIVIFLMCRMYSLILGVVPHPKGQTVN